MYRIALLTISLSSLLATSNHAESTVSEDVRLISDIPYKQGDALSEYELERCKLDVYLPKEQKNFATLVWFHGGGLKNGDKDGRKIESDSVKTVMIAKSLAAAGIAVVAPNYRLSPKVTFPAYIEDAAAAVAWTRQNIAEHEGDVRRIFVGGHSAGGYLALMLGMDTHYLLDQSIKPSDIAGFIPVSGQAMTHYTVRDERGIGKFNVTADEAAPVYFARGDTPPFLVLYADHDFPARAEENAFFVALMKGAKNERITGQMINDRTHGSIASEITKEGDPARDAILSFMQDKISEK